MDRKLFHQKGLIAAASVALAFSSGCGEKDTDTPDDTGPTVTDTGTPADDTSDTSDTSDTTDTSGAPDCTEVEADLVMECCEELAMWCYEQYGDFNSEEYEECYFGPDFDGSTGCIAWGPPVPPARSVA